MNKYQQALLRDCAARTPIYRDDTLAEKIVGGVVFIIFALTLCFL